MASIKSYETKDGKKLYLFKMYIGIDPQTGKKKQTTRRGFRTKKQATLEASRLELEISQGGIKQENNILFSKVYEQWYQAYVNTVRESTVARVSKMFDNHILPYFGNKRIRTISIAQCQKAINDWFKIASYNYRKWYNYTSMVFDYAVKHNTLTATQLAL